MLILPNIEISGELFVHATLKVSIENLENPTVIPRRASIVCQVLAVFKLTGYKSCRAFVKHALLFVMCILCELIIPISLCMHTIKLDQREEG